MTWKKWRLLTGFMFLTGAVVYLLFAGITEAARFPVFVPAGMGFVAGCIALAVYDEGKIALYRLKGSVADKKDLFDFLGAFFGCIAAYQLQKQLGISAVAASSIVGLIGGILIPKYGPAVYCGSFAGMASPEVFPFIPGILAASFICGLLFVAARGIYEGVGGKLGTIAFATCLAVFALFRYQPLAEDIPGWDVGLGFLAYAVFAAAATFLLSRRLNFGPVNASAVVGLASAILLPFIHGSDLGETFSVMAFCASFAGMAGLNRIPSIGHMTAAGILCALLFYFTLPHGGGGGGKLGAIAFASVLAVDGFPSLISRLSKRQQ